jgi:hypothetical protein
LARFLVAAGARPHKDNPRTILEQRIYLRRILIACNQAIEANKELKRFLVTIQDRADLLHRSVTGRALHFVIEVCRLLDNLCGLVKERRFDLFSKAPAALWVLRDSRKIGDELRKNVMAAIAYGLILDTRLDSLRRQITRSLEAPPPELSGINLKGLQMSVEDVAGATWDTETTWPSKALAEKVRAESDEISTNVYRVRLGTEQHSFIF